MGELQSVFSCTNGTMKYLVFFLIAVLHFGLQASAASIEGFYNVSRDISDLDFIARSCLEIKERYPDSPSGLYTIYSKYWEPYSVYCEMDTVGGGWTLVASIHENNINGHCTYGDKWSSEHGYTEKYNGESNWENVNTFGRPEYAASDDYKNLGYFEIQAKRFMIIQVPNDTPMEDFVNSATFQSYTLTSFLDNYGGNFKELFERYPLRDDYYTYDRDNGPSVQMSFVRGDATSANYQYSSSYRSQTESGYAQFRTVSHEQATAAFCPYGKMRPGQDDPEFFCFGITYISGTPCGDFSYMNHGSSSLYTSAYLILYR